jgi:hypothetical protein
MRLHLLCSTLLSEKVLDEPITNCLACHLETSGMPLLFGSVRLSCLSLIALITKKAHFLERMHNSPTLDGYQER